MDIKTHLKSQMKIQNVLTQKSGYEHHELSLEQE